MRVPQVDLLLGLLSACASAQGHIPPCLHGCEIPSPNGLPLGVSAEVSYPEITLRLAPAEVFHA